MTAEETVAGRTHSLIPLARKTFGDDVTICADANGSYDVTEAVAVGRMLEAHGVAFFEEPCPWQDYEQTHQVADRLTIPVAGGEQDTSVSQFRRMINNRVVGLVQPDVFYNGGFIRTLRVARLAEEVGIKVALHGPGAGSRSAAVLQLAAVLSNSWEFQEYPAAADATDGQLDVGQSPGLGHGFRARVLWAARRL